MLKTDANATDKVSEAFLGRLAALEPEGTSRAVVLLVQDEVAQKRTKRLTVEERQSRIEARQEAGRQCLPSVDRVLEAHGGRRLDADVGALGSVGVESTAAGFRALAELDAVKAILEDQPVHLLR